MCSKLLHLNVRHLQVSNNKSVTNVNCGSQKSIKKWYSFWRVYGQYRPSTPGPTKCPCGIRCHGGDGQSPTNTAGFRDVACAWTNTGPGIQHWSTFFQRRSCDKQFWLNDINPSDYFRASCELWSSFPNVEIRKRIPFFPKTCESNIIIGILPAEKLWNDGHFQSSRLWEQRRLKLIKVSLFLEYLPTSS